MRTRSDRCPGASRPWAAPDGMLVRLRLVGGRVEAGALRALAAAAARYGDGRVYLTSRANLQIRGLPGTGAALAPEALAALEATGLLPTRTHELVRNIMVSPLTGRTGGRIDLRPVAARLDALICAQPALAQLSGRFLFVLDDGRGDLVERACDLGLTALDGASVQLRVGTGWGPVLPVGEAAERIVALAVAFADRRGSGPAAPWHVAELTEPLAEPRIEPRTEPPTKPPTKPPTESPIKPLTEPAAPDPRLPGPAPALPFGPGPAGRHVEVGPGGLDGPAIAELTASAPEMVVTPWRGIFVPEDVR